MDGQTAIAFAHRAFDRLHPDPPPWFWKYAASGGVMLDKERQYYTVGFVWMPRASRTGAVRFFEARVNAWNAETTVTLDTPIDTYTPEQLEPYVVDAP